MAFCNSYIVQYQRSGSVGGSFVLSFMVYFIAIERLTNPSPVMQLKDIVKREGEGEGECTILECPPEDRIRTCNGQEIMV
jgi:hypothetical protein